jgi:hypothetical protein
MATASGNQTSSAALQTLTLRMDMYIVRFAHSVVTLPLWQATPSHAHCGMPTPCCVLQLAAPHGSGLLLLVQPVSDTLLARISALRGCRAATARIRQKDSEHRHPDAGQCAVPHPVAAWLLAACERTYYTL